MWILDPRPEIEPESPAVQGGFLTTGPPGKCLTKHFCSLSHQMLSSVQFSSVHFSCSVMSDSLWPHGLQYARLPCPSPAPEPCTDSCPSSRWCYSIISSSVVPFSSCLQSFPASWSFPTSQFFASGSQSIGASVSASVLAINIQDWFPLGLTGSISLLSKELSRVFSSTIIEKHEFFSAHPSLWSNSHICTRLLGKP